MPRTSKAILDFIAKLAAMIPKPRINLTRFHGVFVGMPPSPSPTVNFECVSPRPNWVGDASGVNLATSPGWTRRPLRAMRR